MTTVFLGVSDENLRSTLRALLEEAGYGVRAIEDYEGVQALTSHPTEGIALWEERFPRHSAQQLLQQSGGRLPLIVLLESADPDDALGWLRLGAADVLFPPLSPAPLLFSLERVKRGEEAESRGISSGAEPDGGETAYLSTPGMRDVLRLAKRVADLPTPVLLMGESGSGKGRIARWIHETGNRRCGPWVHVECGIMDEGALARELFGEAEGDDSAMSRAKGGTLYLSGVEDLPMALQYRLVRALATARGGSPREEVRWIVSSQKPLTERVASKQFREDLYYRLSVVPIQVPSLRNRVSEIPALSRTVVERACKRLGFESKTISQDALQRLVDYGWPGNLREMENVLEQAVILSETDSIEVSDLPPHVRAEPGEGAALMRLLADWGVEEEAGEIPLSIKKYLPYLERILIQKALQRTRGNRSKAAQLLEISARALQYKVQDYDIEVTRS